MEKECCCSGRIKGILACSGASNVGQITNEAAKRLDIEKQAKFFCLPGVGGHVSGIVAGRKVGQQVFYSLKVPCIVSFFGCIEAVMESNAREKMELII